MRSRRSAKHTIKDICKWCSKSHPELSESYCFVLHEREIRTRLAPKVRSVGEAYSNGKLKSELTNTTTEERLMRWQRKMADAAYASLGDGNGYKPSINLKYILEAGFVWNQIAVQKPWAVYIIHNGERKRKRFDSLYSAVEWHRKVHVRYPSSGIVSLGRAYGIPPEWRFKKEDLPKRFKWCPRCVCFRVFTRVTPTQRFDAHVKRWNETKARFEWTSRQLWLTECQLCGLTNRDATFRSANLPYEKVTLSRRGKVTKRAIAKGVRRAR